MNLKLPIGILNLILLSVFSLGLSQCVKRKSGLSSITGASISGFVANNSGTPVDGAEILLEGQSTPIGRTDGKGYFVITLDEGIIQKIQQGFDGSRSTWLIYARKLNGPALGAVSTKISLAKRGSIDVGVLVAKELSTFHGQVVTVEGSQVTPAADATVFIGPDVVKTSAEGRFELKNVIPGSIQIVATADKFLKTVEDVEITPGKDNAPSDPIVLFNTKSPTAALFPKSTLVTQDGSRTNRTFVVKATGSAKYIRYYHKIEDLQKSAVFPVKAAPAATPAPAVPMPTTTTARLADEVSTGPVSQWKEISSSIDYSFPTAGPVTLWFQVADATGSVRSDILQTTATINPCESLKGILINGGASLTNKRLNLVSFIGMPNSATRVRISEDQTALSKVPWLSIKDEIEIMLSGAPNVSGGGLSSLFGGGGDSSAPFVVTRQVFAEVETPTGSCPVVSASIRFQPFPENPNMFVINGGAPSTPSKLISIDIPSLPPNAYEMQFTDLTPLSAGQSSSSGAPNPWMRAQSQAVFLFKDVGTRILGLQFKDRDGIVSSSYTSNIRVIQDQAAGFNLTFAQVGNGPPLSPPPPSRYLVMQLIPPVNATAFRFMELITDGSTPNLGSTSSSGNNCSVQDQSAITSRPWLNLVPFMPIYSCGIGFRQFLVQFQTNDGIIISTTNSIVIAPVPETIGNIVINGGQPMSLFPTVQLTVIPPVTAIAMSATNLSLQQTTANNSSVFLFGSSGGGSASISTNDQWLAIRPSLDFKLDSRGVQTIQMRFKDANGNIFTPAVISSIFYDPFPHFPDSVDPMKINNGATTTANPLVTLNLIAPESVFAFRVSQDPSFSGISEWQDIPTNVKSTVPGVEWKVFKFDVPFLISGAAGPKVIYVQYRNELGDRSESESALITYQP